MNETEVGLRRAFLVEMRESRKKGDPRLGFAQINYGRIFVRDYWTLFAIARELECSVSDLIGPPEKTRSGPRYSEVIQSAEEILDDVRALPASVRTLVEERGRGKSWRSIHGSRSGRVIFSLKEDYDRGIAALRRSCGDHLNFLASADNFFVVRPFSRTYAEGTLSRVSSA